MSFQTRESFVRLRNTIQNILGENRVACDCPIYCQVNNTVKAQKSMKDIVKNHVTSKKHHRNFTKLREYFLYAKKTKITTLFNNSSPPHLLCHRSTILESIHWTQIAYDVLCQLRHTDGVTLLVLVEVFIRCAYRLEMMYCIMS